jgi:hypothetical protein
MIQRQIVKPLSKQIDIQRRPRFTTTEFDFQQLLT